MKRRSLYFTGKFLFRREVKHILRRKKSFIVSQCRIASNGFVLARAQNNSDGRIVFGKFKLIRIEPHVKIHLADILGSELPCFQIDEHETLQEVVVENQVDEIILLAIADSLLTSDKRESFSQFEKKKLETIDNCLL